VQRYEATNYQSASFGLTMPKAVRFG